MSLNDTQITEMSDMIVGLLPLVLVISIFKWFRSIFSELG